MEPLSENKNQRQKSSQILKVPLKGHGVLLMMSRHVQNTRSEHATTVFIDDP